MNAYNKRGYTKIDYSFLKTFYVFGKSSRGRKRERNVFHSLIHFLDGHPNGHCWTTSKPGGGSFILTMDENGPKHLGHLSLPSQGHEQEAGLEVEESGLKPALI